MAQSRRDAALCPPRPCQSGLGFTKLNSCNLTQFSLILELNSCLTAMAVRKKIGDKFSAPLSGIQHKLKQVWREVQSGLGDRLSEFDAWAVEQVNESLEEMGDRVSETLENAKESLQAKYAEAAESLTKKGKRKTRRK